VRVSGEHALHSRESLRARLRAGGISLVAGLLILAAKFFAWNLTQSQVVFSDAMESIVNVAAAAFMLFAVVLASRPPDDNHPYGHGKIEFITGGFEGGLIAFAAIVIIYEAVMALIHGSQPQHLDVGMGIVGAAGVANLALGAYLMRTGREHHSPALIADGKHVISDFWTSAGAVVGLLLVWITGLAWIDAVVAIIVAIALLRTGAALIRESARGLMDEIDEDVVGQVAEALEKARAPGIIEIHDLKAINLANFHHVDLHVVVPEFWTVDEAHHALDAYQERMLLHHEKAGELQFHMDPCERAYCSRCDLVDCAVRAEPFEEHVAFTEESVVEGPRPPAGTDAIHDDPPIARDG
jgi:cation diffusion facilitator family transporter